MTPSLREQAPHLVVTGLTEVHVPLSNRDKVFRLHQGEDLISLTGQPGARGRRCCRNGDDETLGLVQSHCANGRGHRRARGDTIVDQENDASANLWRDLMAAVGKLATPELLLFPRDNLVNQFPGDLKFLDDVLVDDADTTRGDRAKRVFLMTWNTKFSNHKDIQWHLETARNFERNRDATPRQRECQNVVATRKLDKLIRQQAPSLDPISKHILHGRNLLRMPEDAVQHLAKACQNLAAADLILCGADPKSS